jgi:tubulin polyglutamylase TTLL6/13
MGILSRKNNLGKNLMLFRRKFPDDYEFFPITWHLP